MKLHISLHDVAPVHLKRIARAEELLQKWGADQITYLMVPQFHGEIDSATDENFLQFCRAPRPFKVEWSLHGWQHLEGRVKEPGPLRERFARRWMTGGEGEFLALNKREATPLLKKGVESFRTIFSVSPSHFVPPAWLWHPELPSALAEMQFRSFETHRGIATLSSEGEKSWIEAPVISWATRTFTRRNGALMVTPLQACLWRKRPLLRLALHPHDFDWPQTIRSIERLLQKELMHRKTVTISQLTT